MEMKTLSLGRKLDEGVCIRIGDVEVWVTPVAFDRGKVRLRFEAPAEVLILREELVGREGELGDGDRREQ